MAQVASALAGSPVRLASQVVMRAPVVLAAGMPGSQTVIRIYALKDGDSVTIRVRSDNSGFAVDHCRATFSLAAPTAKDLPWHGAGEFAAGTGEVTAGPGQLGAATELPADDLYDNVLFQTGRFRLLRHVRLPGPRSAFALAEAAGIADRQPWFGAVPPARAGAMSHELVLGNAGLADAALQTVQASMPGRRMLVAGCDSVWFSEAFCSGRIADGQVTIAAGQGPAGIADGQPVPSPRTGSAQGGGAATGPAWQVRVTDAVGQLLITWEGLRMRDAGPLLHQGQSDASQLAAAD
jgi:hypothetical protein